MLQLPQKKRRYPMVVFDPSEDSVDAEVRRGVTLELKLAEVPERLDDWLKDDLTSWSSILIPLMEAIRGEVVNKSGVSYGYARCAS